MKIVILAGGSGQRLWPLSRKTYPKQFLDFKDGKTLLQQTAHRFPNDDIFVVTNGEYAHMISAQLPNAELIIEPEKRNTGPAIVFAVEELLKKGKLHESDCVLFTPSDQYLSPDAVFQKKVLEAEKAANQGFLVTFGVHPSKPHTGYGYIKANETTKPYRPVISFKEKPSKEVAEKYLRDGGYYWNSGMFVFQAAKFLSEVKMHAPELLGDFEGRPSVSIDTALFEKSKNVVMVPLSLTWSDVGCWDSLYDVLDKDADSNVKQGNVHAVDTKNSLVIGGKRLIATMGIEDLVVIETEDAIYIGKRGDSQKVKEIVERLTKHGARESHEHLHIRRPWGGYSILEEGEGYKIKKIAVHSGGILSLQRHRSRSEHWVVVKGMALVRVEDKEYFLSSNESVFVPKGAIHRLSNPLEEVLEIIEVQVGEYLGEDDIERFEDAYGRSPSTICVDDSV